MIDVRTLCLGILSLGEASGYEIKKTLEEGQFRHFLDASLGSIYPALTRLTEDGALMVRREEQDGRPDKKVYAITPQGREVLAEQLRQPPAEDKIRSDFLFRMVFCDLLGGDRVRELIDEQIVNYRRRCQSIEDQLRDLGDTCPATRAADETNTPAGARFALELGWTLSKAVLGFLEANRDFAADAPVGPGNEITGRHPNGVSATGARADLPGRTV